VAADDLLQWSYQTAARFRLVPSLLDSVVPPRKSSNSSLVTVRQRNESAWRSASARRVGSGDIMVGHDQDEHQHESDANKMDEVLFPGIQSFAA